ncbi:MAG: hypothetical protein JWO67_3763, partial [Streptosporangiaceae bacterium]|nr:hypothetical protein [Streptosporangiaceae bacterium]
DWLLLNSGDNVWTRCRGGHERYEPSLDAMWFDQYCGPTETVHASHEEAMRSLGFDGTFAGIIL